MPQNSSFGKTNKQNKVYILQNKVYNHIWGRILLKFSLEIHLKKIEILRVRPKANLEASPLYCFSCLKFRIETINDS